MKTMLNSRRDHYLARVSIFLVTLALIVGMLGCNRPSPTIQIWNWNDLDAVRNNLGASYLLMNDLDSTTAGYKELASPTANGGKGWQPIGTENYQFTGTFDGQGFEIRDLFINRPDINNVGLFGAVNVGGVIKNIGVVNSDVTGGNLTGGLVGWNIAATVSDSYSSGNVTGVFWVGGLVGSNVNNGTVSKSYSTGSVTGNGAVGGLVGANGGTVSNSYATGNVSGHDQVGGLVGYNGGDVSNSFWDTDSSGQTTSDGGTGKNTTEMHDIATFSGAAWNIIPVVLNQTNPAYIWNIVNNVTYPFLSWRL